MGVGDTGAALVLLEVAVVQLAEDWHEEDHDEENDTDDWMVLVDLEVC
jgi:hypothetical protein